MKTTNLLQLPFFLHVLLMLGVSLMAIPRAFGGVTPTPAHNSREILIHMPISAVLTSGTHLRQDRPDFFRLSAVGGENVPASVSFDATSNTATLTPAVPLDRATDYEAVIDTIDTTTSSPAEFTWRFRTSALEVQQYGPMILDGNDDGSTSRIDLPFPVSVYGATYNSLFINNNGNITFNAALGTYTAFAFPGSTVIVAGFFADVDTRNPGSGKVHYIAESDRVVITWNHVGYFDNQVDKLNTFQIILTREGLIGFSYDDMQWTTGRASGGAGGFGGNLARAGFDAGNSVDSVVLWEGNSAASLESISGKTFFYTSLGGTPQPNQPPVAHAGPDQTIDLGTSASVQVRLDGTASTDDGIFRALTYSWRLGAALLGSEPVINPNLGMGIHDIELTVFDGQLSSTDTVRITVTDTTPPNTWFVAAPDEGSSINSPVVNFQAAGSDNSTPSSELAFSFTLNGGLSGEFGPPSLELDSLPEGYHTVAVVARDASGNIDPTPAERSFTIDRTPPAINLLAKTPSANSALISWTTNEPARSSVTYTPAGGNPMTSPLSILRTNHSAALTNLVPGTEYVLAITATDDAGNQTVANEGNISIPHAPDLLITELTVDEPELTSGSAMTVRWSLGNSGAGATKSGWHDRVTVTNLGTNQTLADAYVSYDPNQPANGHIGPGQERSRVYSFTLPAGASGAGDLLITVVADAKSAVFEYNVDGTAETNNSRSANRRSIRPPALTLSLAESTLIEGDSLSGTVSIQRVLATDLTVTLASSRPTRVNAGPPVTIPAGQSQASFTINAPQNIQIQPLTEVLITASAPGATAAEQIITLLDDDWPFLTMSLDRTLVSEGAGSNAVVATVTRDPATSLPLTVELNNTLPSTVLLPATVDIPAGAASVSFPIGVVDDDIVTGLRTANLSAAVRLNGEMISHSPLVELQIIDNEGPRLEVLHTNGWILKGETAPATVRRFDSNTASALTVQLHVTPADALAIPATVTIPAGETEALFMIEAANDGNSTTIPALLGASAEGLSPGQTELSVTGLAQPDLVVANISAPLEIDSEARFIVSYRIENRGAASTAAPFDQRVFFSTDPVPGNDILLGQSSFTGTLPAATGIDLTTSVRAPRDVGTYWLLVTADANDTVAEISETNNTLLLAQPITVGAAYGAVVRTDSEQVPANTPVVFTGSATRPGGSKVPNVMVNIHIRVGGTERIIAAITNSAGDFTTTWNPLPGEGGDYEIGAAHPGVTAAPTQDSFAILTVKPSFPPGPITFDEGSSATITGEIFNPTAYELTGLTLAAINAPPGLNVQATLPGTTLTPGATMQAGVAFTGATGFTGNRTVTLRITSDQGGTIEVPVSINVRQLAPLLTFSTQPLNASVLRGGQRTVNLTITNNGGAGTGPIDILLPDLPWLNLASPGSIQTIPPGAAADVTFLLSPPADQALTLYNGTMVIDPRDGLSRSLPFAFRVVSDFTGDLEIEAVDEAFYFTAAAPKVEGATVTLRDAITAELFASFDTPASGRVTFPAVPEGWYSLEVASPNHARWKGNLYIHAGESNFRQIFISREWVTYSWTVEEIELQDRYRISVESTFETNVPAPVITVTPAVLDVEDLVVLGQSKVINFTIENHGLIAAENGNLAFESHPFYEIIPLIEDIGQIPAKSSITVPVTVRRIGEFAEDGLIQLFGGGQQRSLRDGPVNVACGFKGRFYWDYICGIIPVLKSERIPGSGVFGDCIGNESPWGLGAGTIATGSKPTITPTKFANKSICDCENFKWLINNRLIIPKLLLDPTKLLHDKNARLEKEFNSMLTRGGLGGRILRHVEPKLTMEIEGDVGICCETENIGVDGDFKIKINPSLKVSADLFPFDEFIELMLNEFKKDFPDEWSEVSFFLMPSVDLDAGASGEAFGEIEIQITKECNEPASFCGSSGEIGFKIFLGAEASFKTTATLGGVSFSGERTFQFGFEWNASIRLRNELPDCSGKWITEHCSSLVYKGGEQSLPLVMSGFDGIASVVRNVELPISNNKVLISQGVCDSEGKLGSSDTRTRSLRNSVISEGVYDLNLESYLTNEDDALQTLLSQPSLADGICATTTISLDQDAVMTRSAFRGTLELANNQADISLSQVGFDLDIRDGDGSDARDHFSIQVSRLTGMAAIDGTGQIGPQTAGSAQWTLIPRDSAALLDDMIYTIGGTIRYNQGGTLFSIPVTPVPITVLPDAALHLKYFHQRDVFSDDPHTPEIEPSVPYTLAVMVENRGAGAARNLSITSGQPEIVDNEKGLLIDFQVIGTEVNGQNLSPSLTANFGLVNPGERKIAKWLMTSSLQGLFIGYAATFEHLDGFGDERLSLIKEVDIHEMIRMIEDPAGDPAFLVNDIADIRDLPDTVHLSDSTTEPVVVHEFATLSSPVDAETLSVTLTSPSATGWTYLRIPDPGDGRFALTAVTRSDGRVIALDRNVWTTDRTFIGLGQRPIYENILHLADHNSTGSYTLTYAPRPDADTTPPESRVADLPAQSGSSIPVRWSGSDDGGIARFDIFVSINGGPWQPWLVGTTSTSAVFQGNPGDTVAFYSVATDRAGNVQSRSVSADAATVVAVANIPPVIEPVVEQSVAEGSTLQYQIRATDPDGPDSALTYALSTPIPGITISSSGLLRWVTAEGEGGSQVEVVVTVTDSGTPPASASTNALFKVVETNSPPTINPVGPQSIAAGQTLTVIVSATDPDIPAQMVTYSLAPGSPVGASINPASGLLTWTPPPTAAGRSHAVGVIAIDSGTPPASALLEFAVNVLEPPNRPPVFDSIFPQLWLQLPLASPVISRRITVSASDPDGDPVTISASVTSLATAAGAAAPNFVASPGNGTGTIHWDSRGVPPGIFTVPLLADDGEVQTPGLLTIRLEPNNEYWRWALAALNGVEDIRDFDMLADPDGDGLPNVYEMTFLRDPLRPDHTPLQFTPVGDFANFRVFDLKFKRHRDAGRFVNLSPAKSRDLLNWESLANAEWQFFLDPQDDTDPRPEAQNVRWRFFVPNQESQMKFRVEGTLKPE